MSLLKRGFTIAELLLVIVIIGIISAMGATITKKSSARAYNLFWHNGYVTLSNAIGDIEYNNSNPSEADPSQMDYETFSASDWAKEVDVAFGARRDAAAPANNTVHTNNGTLYHFAASQGGAIMITMSVPAPKSRTNNSLATTRLFFDPSGSNELIPTSGGDVDLSTRMDLLPVIIDDGTTDRVIQNLNGTNASLKRANVQTFQEAYCQAKGTPGGNAAAFLNCNGVSDIGTKPGMLKFPKLKG